MNPCSASSRSELSSLQGSWYWVPNQEYWPLPMRFAHGARTAARKWFALVRTMSASVVRISTSRSPPLADRISSRLMRPPEENMISASWPVAVSCSTAMSSGFQPGSVRLNTTNRDASPGSVEQATSAAKSETDGPSLIRAPNVRLQRPGGRLRRIVEREG